MVTGEEIKKLRGVLESKKPMLALPSPSIEVVEVTDTKSPEFKKAMEIYEKTFPEEEREENYKIAQYIRNTQKLGYAKKGSKSEFHLLLIKDTSIKEGEQAIGQAQISYMPGKGGVRFGTFP